MHDDPIVEEVRRIRDAYAVQFNYDIDAICRDLREREKKSGRKVVDLSKSARKEATAAAKK
jgi:hypothetical protein